MKFEFAWRCAALACVAAGAALAHALVIAQLLAAQTAVIKRLRLLGGAPDAAGGAGGAQYQLSDDLSMELRESGGGGGGGDADESLLTV